MNDEIIREAVTVLVALVTTVGGVGFLTARAQSKRITAEGRLDDADAQVRLSDAAIRLLAPYKQEAETARNEAARARREAEAQAQRITALEAEQRKQHREILALKRHNRELRQYIVINLPDARNVPEYQE